MVSKIINNYTKSKFTKRSRWGKNDFGKKVTYSPEIKAC